MIEEIDMCSEDWRRTHAISHEQITREFHLHPVKDLPKRCSSNCLASEGETTAVYLGKANDWESNGHVTRTAYCAWCGKWEGYFSYNIDVKEKLRSEHNEY